MSNSVVKVVEQQADNSLLLVIGEDGVITPDQASVEEYLKACGDGADLQIMQVNKSDGRTVDVTVDKVLYMPDHIDEDGVAPYLITDEMDEISRNLLSFRMDHDYTSLTSPMQQEQREEEDDDEEEEEEEDDDDDDDEEDELAQTLSMFEGTSPLVKDTQKPPNRIIKPTLVTSESSGQRLALKEPVRNVPNKEQDADDVGDEQDDEEAEEEDEEEEEEEYEEEDDADDSDFEMDSTLRSIGSKRGARIRKPLNYADKETRKGVKHAKVARTSFTAPAHLESDASKVQAKPQEPSPEQKRPTPKKEKKAPKPAPFDNCLLFSTPDIIRRVGGKQEPSTSAVGGATSAVKVMKGAQAFSPPIKQQQQPSTPSPNSVKEKRLSEDAKLRRSSHSSESSKERRLSADPKAKRLSVDQRQAEGRRASVDKMVEVKKAEQTACKLGPNLSLGEVTAVPDAIAQPPPSQADHAPLLAADVPANLSLEPDALDLDQSILDNINSDLISEDILYQVAQSLVDNAELQSAINKSLNDGNLDLDAPLPGLNAGAAPTATNLQLPPSSSVSVASESGVDVTEQETEIKGTQIVKPDGRVVVLPPIERPTTRSRNKKKEEGPDGGHASAGPSPTAGATPHKTPTKSHQRGPPSLDARLPRHETGSASEVEDDQSDDDPDKLWCICNQPHNNRFMICCDTCEEWYHGKCVNVTKAMGQLMEQEGREWICIYCKDASLTRPMAAARRVRKASKASSGSASSQSKSSVTAAEKPEPAPSVPKCIVCAKPSRNSSIYCSDACILKHAQGVEKVVVFERASGRILSGNNAPTAANLEQWLKEHPGFEVVRSTTNKPLKTMNKQYTQSRLRIVKGAGDEGASLAVQKKGVNIGLLRHSPAQRNIQQLKIPNRNTPKHVSSYKIVSRTANLTQPKIKLIQPQPVHTPIIKATPPKPVAHTSLRTVSAAKERPPVPQKTPKSRQAEEAAPQPKQENIRENVRKTLCEQLTNRLKLVDDIKLGKEEVAKISHEIESQLYKCFGDTGQKYRIKYRSLMFNIKDIKNQTLWRRICEKTINPYQLVRLSPDDLASQELASWRERETKHQLDMITKAELEELGRQKQYVFKTHKGEQELEDSRPSDGVEQTEVITALNADSTSNESSETKKESKGRDKKNKHRDKERSIKERSSRDKDRASSKDKEHRRRSRSRDRTSNRHGRKRSHSRDKDRHRKSARHKKDEIGTTSEKLDKKSKEILEHLVDNKIVPPLEDRLWKHVQQEDITTAPNVDSDSDHEPTSTVTIPTPPRTTEDTFCPSEHSPADQQQSQQQQQQQQPEPTPAPEPKSDKIETAKVTKRTKDVVQVTVGKGVDEEQTVGVPATVNDFVWKGTINMVDVAQISITAHQVSGDGSGLSEELPPCLDVVGRISPDTVWDYIGKMKCSNSKAITLLRLTATNMEEKMPYIALYSYLSSRNRLGVVKSSNKAVKDFYILPLASQKPIPQALLPLNGPGFEESRPALLLGIIVRDRRKRPTFEPGSSAKRVKSGEQSGSSGRSYTPPPVSGKKTPYLPTPINVSEHKTKNDDMDEPYSPEDSDPETNMSISNTTSPSFTTTSTTDLISHIKTVGAFLEPPVKSSQTFQPFANKFDAIPGLENASSMDIQRKMEELDQRIAREQAEIVNMSQNIASSASATDLGTSALASIALPNNLQQILDSIKGIGAAAVTPPTASSSETTSTSATKIPPANSPNLTMPLLLPKAGRAAPPRAEPVRAARKTSPLASPKMVDAPPQPDKPEKSTSVLSSLSEEELIRKAAEMLGEGAGATTREPSPKKGRSKTGSPVVMGVPPPPPIITEKQGKVTAATTASQPPIPGLD